MPPRCETCPEHTEVSGLLSRLDERQSAILEELRDQRRLLERFVALEERSLIHSENISDIRRSVNVMEVSLHNNEKRIDVIYKIMSFIVIVISLTTALLSVWIH